VSLRRLDVDLPSVGRLDPVPLAAGSIGTVREGLLWLDRCSRRRRRPLRPRRARSPDRCPVPLNALEDVMPPPDLLPRGRSTETLAPSGHVRRVVVRTQYARYCRSTPGTAHYAHRPRTTPMAGRQRVRTTRRPCSHDRSV
jgi:hypothetical protein